MMYVCLKLRGQSPRCRNNDVTCGALVQMSGGGGGYLVKFKKPISTCNAEPRSAPRYGVRVYCAIAQWFEV